MYKALWHIINKRIEKDSVYSMFLAVNILCWTFGAVLAGLLLCIILQQPILETLSTIAGVGAYAGIILGLLGGILFLQRLKT